MLTTKQNQDEIVQNSVIIKYWSLFHMGNDFDLYMVETSCKQIILLLVIGNG